MRRSRRRLLMLIALVPMLVLAATGIYMLGMESLEGNPRDFWRALEFAAETVTTTGYGSDTSWKHPLMVLFVIGLQFLGLVLFYMVFPVYLIPFLEERFEARLPRRPPKVRDHVVIYRWGAAVESLAEELVRARVPLVILEHDEATARNLRVRRLPLVYAETMSAGLDNVRLAQARSLIANASDADNATVMLMAQQLGYGGEMIALVEDPYHRKPMRLAGADAVVTPRHALGAALAARASHRISPRVSGIQRLGEKLQVSEIPVDGSCTVAGKTLAEAKVGSRTGTSVIGQWVNGHLHTPAGPDTRIEPRGILVAVGSVEALGRLSELASGERRAERSGPFLVAGYGEVGRKVAQLLRDAGEPVQVIDLHGGEGVDVVGDILDTEVLERLDLAGAQAMIVAIDNDNATLFSTVILKDLAPELPIIARVNEADNVERIHHAGADFAMSISRVSGQILAQRLLHEDALAIDAGLKVQRFPATALAHRHPAALEIRRRTGCSVVAAERGDELIVELGPDFLFQPEDTVYVCGTAEATRRFGEEYA